MIIRIISAVLILWALGFAWFSLFLPQPATGLGQTDAVAVLTGAGGRIDRGLEILEQDKAERMLISGVDRNVKPRELMAQFDMSDALFECCVDLGFDAIDTRTNARETLAWIERRNVKSLRLITTDWHMRRAHYELRQAVPEQVIIYPDAVASEPGFLTLFREYNKYLLRLAAGAFGL